MLDVSLQEILANVNEETRKEMEENNEIVLMNALLVPNAHLRVVVLIAFALCDRQLNHFRRPPVLMVLRTVGDLLYTTISYK